MRRNHVFGFALALAAATTAQTASAQETQGHEQHATEGRRQQGGGQFQRLFQGIQLTDAQQQQLRQIMQEGRPERGDSADRPRGQRGQAGEGRPRGERPQLTAEQRAEFQKRREEMQARRQQQLAKVRGILTAEQRTQFDRNVAQAEAQRQQRGQRQGNRS